ncbi:hypothetical protein H4J59_06285 [Colwellia sp. MB02u-10]|jgi:hypothetical protein|uniref:hypothetical protein n=1 Tax=Colwellia sp. MB02u-10 TaxID=2759828 RepID=UPI0015F38203|nr:hypothetical protein [Colwellia sp. MB02u-10]MBA6340599.1 hypothetical protein [Colwellia sp. MB02u-10]
MKFIELEVRTAHIIHGFDDDNKEVIEEVEDSEFFIKIIPIDRILSISNEYLLVSSSHNRVMYWEYNYSMQELTSKLKRAGLIIA